MELHVLYRTYAGMNSKKRPEWFDRRVALQSLLASLGSCGVDTSITLLVDGSRPADLEDFDLPTLSISGGNCAASFRGAIRAAEKIATGCSEDTLFWIAEDDYLYRPEAMSRLVEVARLAPRTAYLALYTPDDADWHATHPSQPAAAVTPSVEGITEATGWIRTGSTTMTAAVWRDTLLDDARLLRLLSYNGSPFDKATFCTLQGLSPYDLRHVLADLEPHLTRRGIGKLAVKPVMRVVSNLVSRRRSTQRILLVPPTDLAAHLETDMLSADHDWSGLARSIAADAALSA